MRVIGGRAVRVACGIALALVWTMATDALAAGPAEARLAEAAKRRDLQTVRALLDQHVDPNGRQGDGATALHWAAYWGDVETTDRLIRAGAKVDAANDSGVTPLLLASTNEDATVAKRLLAAGANPNATAMSGQVAIMAAARAGRVEIAQALVAHGANVNVREPGHDQTALMWAIAGRHPDVARVLLAAGADVHARSRVRPRKVLMPTSRQASYSPGAYEQHLKNGDMVEVMEGGYTPLLFAAQQDDLDSAKLLLAAGADVNDTAPIGLSALVVAAYSDGLEVGAYLLAQGADPNAAGAGYAALHVAVLKGNLKLVEALLAHGANPNAPITKASGARRQSADYSFGQTLVGATPLYLAAKFDEIPIMRALAAAGADRRFKMPDGTTSVMVAMDTPRTDSGDVEGLGRDRRDRYVFFRLMHTSSPDDVTPKTPEDEENDVLEMVTFLSSADVDIATADKDGNTAMHVAAAKGLNRVIQYLASRHADVNARNKRGQTPLDLANAPRRNRGGDELGNQESTAALLRSLGAQSGQPVSDARPRGGRTPR